MLHRPLDQLELRECRESALWEIQIDVKKGVEERESFNSRQNSSTREDTRVETRRV